MCEKEQALLFEFALEDFDMNDIDAIHKVLQEQFPDTKIIFIPKDIKYLGLIEVNKTHKEDSLGEGTVW